MKLRGMMILAAWAAALATGCRMTGSEDNSDTLFYGTDNQSANMTFATEIELAKPDGVRVDADILKPAHKRYIDDAINLQLMHIFGAFSVHPEYESNPGIIELKSQPVIRSARITGAGTTITLSYQYTDRVVFQKRLLSNTGGNISFVLPRDPNTIYSKGFRGNSTINKCTDPHYNSEGDFWYFWNPKKSGCPIKPEDLVTVNASLDVIPNTQRTYPYYSKILSDNGNGRKFTVMYLVGIDESFSSTDLGRGTFEESLGMLIEKGYAEEDAEGTGARRKLLKKSFPAYDVEIDMRLVDPSSAGFISAAAEGIESRDLFIYDGHSGLGGYLSVERFESVLGRRLTPPKNKHQIYFFNGCSTFSYYNKDFFDLKKTAGDPHGRKFLDVMTTSIGATFDIGARHDVALISSLVDGRRPSWQTIINKIYKVDPSQSALTHVNGDEDNPTSPD